MGIQQRPQPQEPWLTVTLACLAHTRREGKKPDAPPRLTIPFVLLGDAADLRGAPRIDSFRQVPALAADGRNDCGD